MNRETHSPAGRGTLGRSRLRREATRSRFEADMFEEQRSLDGRVQRAIRLVGRPVAQSSGAL
eukprot:1632968-Pyramimonas_sp.AAC.1